MTDQKTKNVILVVATAWGPKHGGINSFNKAFCIELAKYIKEKKLDYEVYCIVYDINVKDYQEASKNDVTLIGLQEKDEKSVFSGEKYGQHIYKELQKVNKLDFVKYVILHDIITGNLFYHKNIFPTSKPKWAAIHHMHYLEYIHLYGQKKEDEKFKDVESQYNLFKDVDFIFAVGPLLKSKLKDYLKSKNIHKKIIEIIPGLNIKKTNINYKKRKMGLTFGRLDEEHDKVKLASLVMDSWFQTIGLNQNDKTLENSILTVVGIDENDYNKNDSLIKKYGRKLRLKKFTEDHTIMDFILKDSTVVFMLSRHEGFGLSGWEAIGAGIPLITTKNSGLWKCIENYKKGKYIKCLHGIDLKNEFTKEKGLPYKKEEVSQVIEQLDDYFKNPNKWHASAIKLRDALKDKLTWENTAKTFLEEVDIKKEENKLNASTEEETDSNAIDTPKKIPEFAEKCVQESHSLILSHRTNIIEMKGIQTYKEFRHFLNPFLLNSTKINGITSGLNRTLLIFIIDFGGEYKAEFYEQALYNCLTLQSAFKAFFLVPPYGRNRSLTANENPGKIMELYYPGVTYDNKYERYLQHYLLLNSLSNRVVILIKNYNDYLNNLKENEDYCSQTLPKHDFTRLIESGISKRKEMESQSKKILDTEDYILMVYKPYLGYLGKEEKKNLEKKCTNIRNSKDEAFGLYSRVSFDDFNAGNIKKVKCYKINRDTEVCEELTLASEKSIEHLTLFEPDITNTMRVVSMSASYFLATSYWSAEIKSDFWHDYKNRSECFEIAFNEIEGYGFNHLTLPQFLNIPIIFPDKVNLYN